jgi:DNA-directed RNA polymerase specialized sigma24 family protein
MTSPPTSDLPTDPEDLAALAADPAQSRQTRDRAFEALAPLIRRIARRLTGRFPGPASDDLLEESGGEVWRALSGFQAGASFEGWCYGVLRNHLFDRFRQEHRARTHRLNWAALSQAPGLQQALERGLDQAGLFPPADLATLRTWPLPQRLALMSLSGLWEKVPPEEWDAWVGEYRASRDHELPDPFPPDQLRHSDDLAGRNAVLSAAMRVSRNRLSVWLFRYKPRLRGLQYVRALLERP